MVGGFPRLHGGVPAKSQISWGFPKAFAESRLHSSSVKVHGAPGPELGPWQRCPAWLTHAGKRRILPLEQMRGQAHLSRVARSASRVEQRNALHMSEVSARGRGGPQMRVPA